MEAAKIPRAVPVEDIEVYDIEASFTVNLSPSGDGKDHVAVFSIGLSLNTKSDGYKSIGTEGLKAKETLIKNDINTIVSGYTMEQFREDEQSVKDAILEDLQEMFGSDFIVGVSFSSVNTQ
ncbi:MAG: flagellar basal body-associated FliL family protein [Roseburia inulinivorans]